MCDAPHENQPWVMRKACLNKVLPIYLPTKLPNEGASLRTTKFCLYILGQALIGGEACSHLTIIDYELEISMR